MPPLSLLAPPPALLPPRAPRCAAVHRACLLPVAAAVLLLTPTAPPAHAHAADPVGEPEGRLRLSVGSADLGQERETSWIRGTRLRCPARARQRHPAAAEACAQLATGHSAAPPRARRCGEERPEPVTATVEGTWQGWQVSWRKTFGSVCELRARTGAVFAF